MALGLSTSESLATYWSRNTRRRVFYDFPNGTAPLAGLLSMMEGEETPLPEFGWNEERYTQIQTLTSALAPNTAVVFYIAGSTTTAGTPVAVIDATTGDSLRMYVADASNFQVDDVITVFNVDLTPVNALPVTINLGGRVTATGTTPGLNWIDFELNNTVTSTILNSASANQGKYVYLGGSGFAEGSRSRTGRNKYPIELKNFVQLHRNAFELTSFALKAPLVYDKTGHYHKALKDNGIDHLTGIEHTLFWGERRQTTSNDPDNGQTVRRYFSGGLLWFLKQWELGSSGVFPYAHANVSTQTDWQTYTNKRIIKLAGATITRAQFNELNSRVFEKTNSSEWCKLCLCGPGYLNRVTDMFERQIQYTSLRENNFKGFDFELVMHKSNSGTVYYKQHPLFTEPVMRNSAFYIDLGHLRWRYLTDHDTDIHQNIQYNDALLRKDEYITVGGADIAFAESHMFVDNLGGITN